MTLTDYTAQVRLAIAQADRGMLTDDELQQRLLELAATLFGHMD